MPEGHLDQGIIVATNTILTLDWALYIRVFPRDFWALNEGSLHDHQYFFVYLTKLTVLLDI